MLCPLTILKVLIKSPCILCSSKVVIPSSVIFQHSLFPTQRLKGECRPSYNCSLFFVLSICRTLHFVWLNFVCQVSAYWVKHLISDWMISGVLAFQRHHLEFYYWQINGSNFSDSLSCSTLSKAFWKSKYIKSTSSPFSRILFISCTVSNRLEKQDFPRTNPCWCLLRLGHESSGLLKHFAQNACKWYGPIVACIIDWTLLVESNDHHFFPWLWDTPCLCDWLVK